MRYITFSTAAQDRPRIGAAFPECVVDLEQAASGWSSGSFPRSLLALIQSGPEAWRRMNDLAGNARGSQTAGAIIAIDAIRWHAPIPKPAKNIFCLGHNYVSHMTEANIARGRQVKIPEFPVFFSKASTTVNGPFDPIPWERSVTEQVDYEAELGVIVGIGGKDIPRAKALDHVFGYTVINDFSARDVQLKHMQWFKGKSLDGFCPIGPVVVTADEFGNPQSKKISLRVDGETRQQATTADMIFPVDVILEWLSRGMSIEAGDIIATGTPEGVGMGRVPPVYLNDGEVVEVEVEGIGTLRNRIHAI